jgi:ribose transport system permease protein
MSDASSTIEAVENRISVLLRRELVWIILAIVVALLAVASHNFLTGANLLNILRQVSIVGVVAIGVVIVVVAGNFDLSVGAILTLAAVVSVQMQPTNTVGTILSIVVPLLLGVGVGAVNGSIVGGLRANSIIVTVGSQFVVTGGVLLYVAGQHVRVDGATPFYVAISGGYALGIPMPIYIFAIVVVIGHLIMQETVFGRFLRAIGGNTEAARLVGISVARHVRATYMLSGGAAAISGILLASRVRNLDPTVGIGYEFSALTAVVLGGASLTGGRGDALHTLAGILLLGVISNGMRLFDLSFNLQLLVQGAVLVFAVAMDARGKASER